jgi:hypothetical protein
LLEFFIRGEIDQLRLFSFDQTEKRCVERLLFEITTRMIAEESCLE